MSDVMQVGDRLQITFDRWTPEAYDLFLRSKKLPEHRIDYDHERDRYILSTSARFAPILGEIITRDSVNLPVAEHLFDYQDFFVRTALAAKRYAVWADTGLGKTFIGLEFARHVAAETGRRVLIISPLNIVEQWREEAATWYGDGLQLARITSGDHLREWCEAGADGTIGICNPEKLLGHGERVDEISALGGVVLDEASILKGGGGRTKWTLIKSCRGIEYKLSLTATPAPNDTMEYASQGSFLEKLRHEGEILWTFFRRDKDGNWFVKEHARDAFYRFMSGWSVYLRSPARYGFADNLKDLPEPEILIHTLEPTREQMTAAQSLPDSGGQLHLFEREALGIVSRTKMSQIAKGFMYGENRKIAARYETHKPGFVADLVRADAGEGRQVLVWTTFDAESEILRHELAGVAGVEVLTGKVAPVDRPPIIERFRKGNIPVLITRAAVLGHGLNFQACTSMVFSGFDDSFERFYQAVRRAYRYGQKKSVRVHIPYIPELEGAVWDNITAKQNAFERDASIMEAAYYRAMQEVLPHEPSN